MKDPGNLRYLSVLENMAFSVAGPKLWNALPLNIREEMITTDFKRTLKNVLFSNSVSFYQRVNMKWLIQSLLGMEVLFTGNYSTFSRESIS